VEEIIKIAKDAGKITLKYFRKGIKVKFKRDRFDPVTRADKESDAYIRLELKKLYPKDRILSEENLDVPSSYSGRVWIIDPLDGTKSFIEGKKDFSVMIGLCIDAVPVLGVVYAPAKDLLYYGEKGKGAFMIKNGIKKRIKVSKIGKIADSTLITRNISKERRELDSIVDNIKVKKRKKIGSIGLKLGLISNGEADLYIMTNPRSSKWDTCAPQAILEEAGGKMTHFSGDKLDYAQNSLQWDNFIATNGKLHGGLVKTIKKLGYRH
jgi:3'(2'), 5'-bisphosphate nucleotidase